MKKLAILVCFFVLAWPALAGAEEHCHKIGYMGTDYEVCAFDPHAQDIRIYNADIDDTPYGGFRALAKDIWLREKRVVRFAVNGGMYHWDLSPVGLFIENGAEKVPASTNTGWGNFHLLPNGIFYIDSEGAGVEETKAFLAAGRKPAFATQSGPMLVIDGNVHPAFLPKSDSFKIRNGVGIDDKGRAVFATSISPVRFYDFALFYRDVLDCRNALFLDGTISSLWVPEWNRQDQSFPLGPIIAVTTTLP